MVRTRHFEKRNIHTFYIREQFKPVWDRFLELAKKDEKIQRLRYKNKSGLISIAIMQLIYNYVLKKDKNFKVDNTENNNEVDIEDETN